jgi:hypothetical protein
VEKAETSKLTSKTRTKRHYNFKHVILLCMSESVVIVTDNKCSYCGKT